MDADMNAWIAYLQSLPPDHAKVYTVSHQHVFQRGWQAATEKAQERINTLLDALEFATSAIEDAILLEDGLDGGTGEAVLEMMDKAAGNDLC